MRKEVYISELSRHLRKLPEADVRDIVADYEDYFRAGHAAGKTDEQIVEGLGQPKAVAQEILMNNLVRNAEDSQSVLRRGEAVMKMLGLFVILAPFNFFMLLCPFLVIFCLLMAGWTVPLAVGAAALAAVVFLFQSFSILGAVGLFTALSLICMWLGTLGAVVLGCIVMLVITKVCLNLVISYVKWNVNFITSRKA